MNVNILVLMFLMAITFSNQQNKITMGNYDLSQLDLGPDQGFYSIIEYDIDSPEILEDFVELFSGIQKKYVSFYPGYISSTFVASTDGKRVYNLIHWNSESDFKHFESHSDTKSRRNAITKALEQLDNKAHFRENGAPRYRIVKVVQPENKQ